MSDPTIEKWLDSHGITWTYEPNLDIDRIDDKASTTNQARDLPVDPETVDRYAADMAAGDHFPPVVARTRNRSNKVTLIGGNHRHHAARKAKVKTLGAYLVDVEPEMALRLAIEDNRHHGTPCSTEERVGHALHLIALGVTKTEAARIAGTTIASVAQREGVADADKRAANLGVTGIALLPPTARYQLSQIQADPVFAAAAQAAVDQAMTSPQITAMRRDIAAARSERDALSVVGEHTEAAEADNQRKAGAKSGVRGGRSGGNPRVTLLQRATSITMLDPAAVRLACADDTQRKDARTRIKALTAHLIDIDRALAK